MASSAFIKKLWNWFDVGFLPAATAFLLVFTPLYPKIPLGEIIPGYIVRVRLEDFVIFAIFLWWVLQVLRRKVEWRTPLTLAIGAYLGIGLLSNILGVVLTQTIPAEMLHFGKSTLHWLRHIEYFSLFFLAYASVKNRKQGLIFLSIVAATVLAVVVYGYGQKYYYWPVFSTMNREFSKGQRLYLGPFARVQSTFAGHYDLGGYLAFLLPLMLALFFAFSNKALQKALELRPIVRRGLRWLFGAAWFTGLWLIVLSASRASFGGYLFAAGLVVLFFGLRRGWLWFFTRGFLVLSISVIMMVFVGDLTTRFAQLIDQGKHPQVHAAFHTVNDYFKNPQKLIGMSLPSKPSEGKSVDELERELNAQGLSTSDTQPSPNRPSDVYSDVPEQVFDINDPAATLSGAIEKDGKYIVERTFSDCALTKSLSVCIRLETLWPRAIRGFLNNPLVGSGYATLTKESVSEFTEAESTDNNFLRTLGENGALGFFFYYGAMGLALYWSFQAFRRSQDEFIVALASGFFAGTVALMINAMYIDVFVASKVAYTFWAVTGLVLAVFVREGLVAQNFAFDRHARQSDADRLSALLRQVEWKDSTAPGGMVGYLSTKKRSQKSKKPKRTAQRRRA